jgi:nitroreductase
MIYYPRKNTIITKGECCAMNFTIENIKNRRSIRKYKAEQIKDDELQQILEFANFAPNARNQQKWHFTVIQNKDVLDRMVSVVKECMMNTGDEFFISRATSPGYNTFHHAPTVILISAEQSYNWALFDCGTAAQNIALAAESLNIGSCIIASSAFAFSSSRGDEFKKELGIPASYEHICVVALGYKDENPEVPLRNNDVFNYVK